MIRTAIWLFALALLGTGCSVSVIDVEATIPEACVTYNRLAFDAADPNTTTFTQSFVVSDLGGLDQLAQIKAQLEFSRVEAHATSGIVDLSFVESAQFSLESGDPASSLPVIDAFQCDGDCLSSGLIAMPAAAHHDALPYLATGSVLVNVALNGPLPTTDWTMDASVCLSGSAEYKH